MFVPFILILCLGHHKAFHLDTKNSHSIRFPTYLSVIKNNYGFSARIQKSITSDVSPSSSSSSNSLSSSNSNINNYENSSRRNYGISARLVKPKENTVDIISSSSSAISSPNKQVAIEVPPPVAIPEVITSKVIIPEVVTANVIIPEVVVTKEVEIIKEVTAVDTEEMLKEQISKENSRREKRFNELSQLQSQLTKSISKKQEVESIIIEEINLLRTVISEEITNEKKRLSQLSLLYDSFTSASISKNSLLQSESKILEQMKDVRNKIFEQVIVMQLDEAIEKKQSLILIERNICDDIRICGENINTEITETKVKLTSLTKTYDSLPPVEDINAARSYSWNEVEDLQTKILGSIKNSMEVDNKIRIFTNTFSTVMQRRGLVLGENTELLAEIAAVVASSKATATIAIESQEDIESTFTKSSEKEPSISKYQLEEILKSQSDSEFSATATEALKRTASSIASATLSIFDISKRYFKSTEAEDAKQSFLLATSAMSDISKSVSEAFNAARSVWSSEVTANLESVTTTDEYVAKLYNGIQEIIKNEELKVAVTNVSKNTQTSAKQIGIATNKVTSTISTELNQSDKWNLALKELSNNISVLFTVLTIGTKRFLGERLDRQLPQSKL